MSETKDIDLSFTILGNQEDPEGNPIPYKRLTQKSKYFARGQRYQGWKGHVQQAFLDSLGLSDRRKFEYVMAQHKKPIKVPKESKAYLETDIYFSDETHGDPSNIIKGIEDALFVDDKHVDLKTSHECRAEEGKVDVRLKAEVII